MKIVLIRPCSVPLPPRNSRSAVGESRSHLRSQSGFGVPHVLSPTKVGVGDRATLEIGKLRDFLFDDIISPRAHAPAQRLRRSPGRCVRYSTEFRPSHISFTSRGCSKNGFGRENSRSRSNLCYLTVMNMAPPLYMFLLHFIAP